MKHTGTVKDIVYILFALGGLIWWAAGAPSRDDVKEGDADVKEWAGERIKALEKKALDQDELAAEVKSLIAVLKATGKIPGGPGGPTTTPPPNPNEPDTKETPDVDEPEDVDQLIRDVRKYREQLEREHRRTPPDQTRRQPDPLQESGRRRDQ